MSFSDFKNIEQVIGKYPLLIKQEKFLPDLHLELPDWFLDNINFSLQRKAVLESETFFRENFIFPFLHHAWKRHEKLKLWTNRQLNYDDQLFGEPDYLVSFWPEAVIDKLVNIPLLAVAEAKKQDFEQGWAQCLTELIACQKINEDESLIIYGIVSTGIFWEFGKLEKNVFNRHIVSYSINDPQKIFGILDFLFAECENQIESRKQLNHK